MTSTLPLTQSVLDQAIVLRQQRRMSLGDALVASTAIVYNHTLATHNVKDFTWIDGLTVVDPLADQEGSTKVVITAQQRIPARPLRAKIGRFVQVGERARGG